MEKNENEVKDLSELSDEELLAELEEMDNPKPEIKEENTKKTKGKNILYDIILILGVLALAYSGIRYYNQRKDWEASETLYEDLAGEFVSFNEDVEDISPEALTYGEGVYVYHANPEDEAEEVVYGSAVVKYNVERDMSGESTMIDVPWYHLVNVNIANLQEKVNRDVIAWIYFENKDININYPVVYSKTKEYYLRRSIDGNYATAGTIYVDDRNATDFEDKRTIVYGHNMHDFTMFGNLRFFRNDNTYFENHKYFQMITDEKRLRYEIVAYHEIEGTDVDAAITYSDDEEDAESFEEWVDGLNETALKKTKTLTTDDTYLTLFTCKQGDHDKRFVLEAVLIDTYEVQ